MREKVGDLGLALIAAVIVLIVGVVVFNLLGMYSVTRPIAGQFVWGSSLGIVIAIAHSPRPQWGLGWVGWLAILLPFVALLRWVAIPLISQYVGDRSEPVLAGFDGSNPAVLLPGCLYLASFGLTYAIYALIAFDKSATE